MNLRLLFFLLCLAPIILLNGQEQIGLRLNSLSGIHAVKINPAAPATTPYRWEFNIFEASAFFSNNYAFFRNARVRDLLDENLNQNILLAPNLSNPETLPPGRLILDFNNDSRRRFAYLNTTISGPSFYYKIDRYNSIGLVTNVRFIGSVSGVDNDLSYYQFNELGANEEINVSPFQGGLVGFTEYGINYTMSAPAPGGTFNLGITAKLLRGYDGLFFSSREEMILSRTPENGLSASGARFKYGFSDHLTAEDYQLQNSGTGVGFDVGMYATVDGYEPGEYVWKIGFSILDIGEIRFKETAQRHGLRLSSTDQINLLPENYDNIEDLNQLDELAQAFSFDTTRDSLGTFQDKSISVMLPSAVSFQVDHAITSNIFIGGLIHQYLPLGTDGLRRGSLLAIAPRFEQKWVTISLPFSLYNWQQARFGAAVRLGPLTIGSDHLGSWMNRKDLYGSDLYVGFSFFPFGNKGRKGGNNGRLPCYSF